MRFHIYGLNEVWSLIAIYGIRVTFSIAWYPRPCLSQFRLSEKTRQNRQPAFFCYLSLPGVPYDSDDARPARREQKSLSQCSRRKRKKKRFFAALLPPPPETLFARVSHLASFIYTKADYFYIYIYLYFHQSGFFSASSPFYVQFDLSNVFFIRFYTRRNYWLLRLVIKYLLSKSESVKFSLIESVICLFTGPSVNKYFSLLNQLIFTDSSVKKIFFTVKSVNFHWKNQWNLTDLQ